MLLRGVLRKEVFRTAISGFPVAVRWRVVRVETCRKAAERDFDINIFNLCYVNKCKRKGLASA